MWVQTADGETVHEETGIRLDDRGYRDGERIVNIVWPKGAITLITRNHSGWWKHPWLPASYRGGFSTAQACASDLLDRVLRRGVHAGTTS